MKKNLNVKIKTEAEWKNELTPARYRVMREGGTEPAFTGEYWNTKDKGKYLCGVCGNELFSSDAKFDSGTGWPRHQIEHCNAQAAFLRKTPVEKDNVPSSHPSPTIGVVESEVLGSVRGWPSFSEPVSRESVRREPDSSHDLERTEVICSRCGSHLGHVFGDGPKILADGRPATGQRFCINSAALDFKPQS